MRPGHRPIASNPASRRGCSPPSSAGPMPITTRRRPRPSARSPGPRLERRRSGTAVPPRPAVAQSSIPVIEITRAARKGDALAGLERWKEPLAEGGRGARAGRRPRRLDARALDDLDPGAGQPEPRRRGRATAPGSARSGLRPADGVSRGRSRGVAGALQPNPARRPKPPRRPRHRGPSRSPQPTTRTDRPTGRDPVRVRGAARPVGGWLGRGRRRGCRRRVRRQGALRGTRPATGSDGAPSSSRSSRHRQPANRSPGIADCSTRRPRRASRSTPTKATGDTTGPPSSRSTRTARSPTGASGSTRPSSTGTASLQARRQGPANRRSACGAGAAQPGVPLAATTLRVSRSVASASR